MQPASRTSHVVCTSFTVLAVCFSPMAILAQPERPASAQATRIVLLGTGTPSPDPERSGAATAIVVNGTPYLIDFGRGVVRRIAPLRSEASRAWPSPTCESHS